MGPFEISHSTLILNLICYLLIVEILIRSINTWFLSPKLKWNKISLEDFFKVVHHSASSEFFRRSSPINVLPLLTMTYIFIITFFGLFPGLIIFRLYPQILTPLTFIIWVASFFILTLMFESSLFSITPLNTPRGFIGALNYIELGRTLVRVFSITARLVINLSARRLIILIIGGICLFYPITSLSTSSVLFLIKFAFIVIQSFVLTYLRANYMSRFLHFLGRFKKD